MKYLINNNNLINYCPTVSLSGPSRQVPLRRVEVVVRKAVTEGGIVEEREGFTK